MENLFANNFHFQLGKITIFRYDADWYYNISVYTPVKIWNLKKKLSVPVNKKIHSFHFILMSSTEWMHMASAFFIHHGVQQTNTPLTLIYNIKAPHVCMMWLTIAIKVLDINNFQRKLNGTLWPKNEIDINGFKHTYEQISCTGIIWRFFQQFAHTYSMFTYLFHK